ncbi:MAG: IS3 family transposase [Actinobacteria bacterium]|nr:IS3 family transposase [Actinomycetota bacterium]
MQTPRSSFYYKPMGNKISDTDLADKINEIALEFPFYGYRRITAALRGEDMIVNHKKIYRIMKSENILCSIRRSFKRTTNSNHNFVKYPNLIKGVVPLRVNEIWHADITYSAPIMGIKRICRSTQKASTTTAYCQPVY